MWWITAIAAMPSATTLVVGLGDVPLDESELAAIAMANADTDATLSHQALVRAWMRSEPAEMPPDSVGAWLDRARRSEAAFELGEARALRLQVVADYHGTLKPTEVQRDGAAQALAELAAAAWNENETALGDDHARELARLFPRFAPDAATFPPAVLELFDNAHRAVRVAPQGQLLVAANAAGTLWIDGRPLAIERDLVVSLPAGHYRVWLNRDGQWSWPHAVDVQPGVHAPLEIDARLDQCLVLQPALHLTCEDFWPAHLEQLRRRAHADRVVGVVPPDQAKHARLIVLPLPPPQMPGAVTTVHTNPATPFSPWSLVPLGVGQFAQDRPIAGGIYLGAEMSLATWHLSALLLHRRALNDNLQDREAGLRTQRNVSAALLYGTMLATIAEAIVYGALR